MSQQSTNLSKKDQLQNCENNLNMNAVNIRNLTAFLLEMQAHPDWQAKSNLEKHLVKIKHNSNQIKTYLNNYYTNLINIKIQYSSTYLKLNQYISFKDLCLKLKEFLQQYETNLNLLNNMFNWDINLLACKNQGVIVNDELNDILVRLNYLNVLIQTIQDFSNEILFKTIRKMSDSQIQDSKRNDYDDDETYENDNYEWLNEKFSRLPTVSHQLSPSDKILIRFYYKHIENNFNEIQSNYKLVVDFLSRKTFEQPLAGGDIFDTCSNRLALNGHKLVFICDTLIRNLADELVKTFLQNLSNNLSDHLKLYVIRAKVCISDLNDGKMIDEKLIKNSSTILNESSVQIFDCSAKLKDFLFKYI
jgi:hypothetical protein